ncbi:hypothetical protein BU15DRAFT_52118 [Melanogaster broomeanus]|nr:hypothetical protein BU15DRAFT_52118 [Melanogaster broomeanus]
MRHRGPPSALRLFQGPLPPRHQPKHTLPSVPCPAFHPEAFLLRGPALPHRSRQSSPSQLSFPDLPPLDLELAAIGRLSSSGNSSPTSSPSSVGKRLRGPWDNSSSIGLRVDVDSILAMPKPAAIGA